jgi:2-amino-4-hydroxy-6-hydroxymethyldihydropteridine diphosphokinase
VIRVFVGLGSNVANPVHQLYRATAALMDLPLSSWCASSSFYSSKPEGPQDQPDFINAVAAFDTNLTAMTLLMHLQRIETQQNRIKKRHWGERTIDLDLLLYGGKTISMPELTVPHPRMQLRDFVMVPLMELQQALAGVEFKV